MVKNMMQIHKALTVYACMDTGDVKLLIFSDKQKQCLFKKC